VRIAVTGSTGFVGQSLLRRLAAAGHETSALQRERPGREPAAGVCLYDPLDVESVRLALEGCEAVVNLAGENLLSGRWTAGRREALRASRIESTRILVDAMAALPRPPAVLVSASAVGFYGSRGAEALCAESEREGSDDFLGRLCHDWEEAAREAEKAGVRVVLLRIGMVVGPGGGGLQKMEGPFQWGLGGRVASGTQVVSWIHLDDLCSLILRGVEGDGLAGAVNGTAPHPVSNAELTHALAKTLRRPAFLPVPAFALKLLFGAASVVMTTGQRALPSAALKDGFVFAFPTIEDALGAIYPPAT
jgi:uncharacterized protein (TIGR01777 family)